MVDSAVLTTIIDVFEQDVLEVSAVTDPDMVGINDIIDVTVFDGICVKVHTCKLEDHTVIGNAV